MCLCGKVIWAGSGAVPVVTGVDPTVSRQRGVRLKRGCFVDGDLDLTRREVEFAGHPVALACTEFRRLAGFV